MVEEKVTFCRICEAVCGMVATVDDGVITKLRPDPAHPLSQGQACPKGIAMLEVHADPDRVLHPLKRRADGSGFDRVDWDEALDDIGARLRAVRSEHGGESIGWYMGNPGAFSYSHPVWVKGFIDALGSQHYYTASSQDVSNRFAASAMLYGSPAIIPIPDLDRTELLVVVGANPFVSHASLLTAPRIREDMRAIVERGGRVVVIDPRRTETARNFEHVAIRPDTDAWLLLAMLNVLFAEGLADRAALAAQSRRQRVAGGRGGARHPGGRRRADRHRRSTTSARSHATSPPPTVPRSTAAPGSCLGRFGTLVSFLLDAVAIVSGNLDRPGGSIFGDPALGLAELAASVGADTYGSKHSRVGGFPDVLGAMPASLIPREITTEGKGSLRALFVSAGNPVLSVPDSEGMAAALRELDLLRLDRSLSDRDQPRRGLRPARRPRSSSARTCRWRCCPSHARSTSSGRSRSSNPPVRHARSGRSSRRSPSASGSCRRAMAGCGCSAASASRSHRAAWPTRSCASVRSATASACVAAV